MDSKIENKIIYEITNDAFWLAFILEIKRGINNDYQKEILSSFLVFFSSIFCEETIKGKFAKLSGKRNITLKEIEDFRNYNLKYCPSSISSNSNKVINEMGLNFENYCFDIVLTLDKNILYDINFRSWELDKKEKFELLDGIVATIPRWIEIVMKPIYDDIKKIYSSLIPDYIKKIKSYKFYKKSYSVFRLFDESKLNTDEKIYILQRYGLIKSILFIDNIFKENFIFDIGDLHLDFKVFITKCKATLIEMFWNDINVNSNLGILNTISIQNKKIIPDNFYTINRKSRNNLHYCDYHELSEDDYDYLNKYQNIYLNNVLSAFDNEIFIKFGIMYDLLLGLAKLDYWCKH